MSGHVDIPYSGPVCKPRKDLTRAIGFSACPMSPYGAWAELHGFRYNREASKCPGGHQSDLYHIPSYWRLVRAVLAALVSWRQGGWEAKWWWGYTRHQNVVGGRHCLPAPSPLLQLEQDGHWRTVCEDLEKAPEDVTLLHRPWEPFLKIGMDGFVFQGCQLPL